MLYCKLSYHDTKINHLKLNSSECFVINSYMDMLKKCFIKKSCFLKFNLKLVNSYNMVIRIQ